MGVVCFCRFHQGRKMNRPLRAKSVKKGDRPETKKSTTLTAHTAAVVQTAKSLGDSLLPQIKETFGLSDRCAIAIKTMTTQAAYFHDWGKSDNHFQEMVYERSCDVPDQERKRLRVIIQKRNKKQKIRHEVCSGILLLEIPEIREWAKSSVENLHIVAWAAMGHHLKLKDISETQEVGSILSVPLEHPDFTRLMKMGKVVGLPKQIPSLENLSWTDEDLEDIFARMTREAIWIKQDWTAQDRINCAIVKATTLAADIAGSAIPIAGESLKTWVASVVNVSLTGEDLEQLIANRLKGNPLREFQIKAGNSTGRVVAIAAGCGTGKTIAAYLWAVNKAVGKKLFFCYPTMGTATQAYRDYSDGLNEFEMTLAHSHSDLDRELLSNGETDDSEEEDKMASFEIWRQKIVICTVDTVLGIIQNSRRSLYAWPALVKGVFVFDEVHQYDKQLFGSLLQFLRVFRSPALLMSASFSLPQLRAIEKEVGKFEVIKGPQELEVLKRYCFCRVSSKDDAWEKAIAHTQQANSKILWVVNSVQTCINLYREAKNKLGEDVEILIYHSRFRYLDRFQKHKKLVSAFRSDRPCIAFTTQVCEVSLDIDASLLVSEVAPAHAIIQRLGRLKRYMRSPQEVAGDAVFYPSSSQRVYGKEIETGDRLIDEFDRSLVSQKDLADFMATVNGYEPVRVESNWLSGDESSYPGPVRDGGYTISALLEQDMATIRQEAKSTNKGFLVTAKKYALAIPNYKKKADTWKKNKYYRIAPSKDVYYSPETGAEPCSN